MLLLYSVAPHGGIQGSMGTDGSEVQLVLLDDGNHGDGLVADGTYGGRTNPLPLPGYVVYAQATAYGFTVGTVGATEVLPRADLSISKTGQPNPATVGQELTYTLPVQNNGPQEATNAVVTDALPQGAEFVSARSSQGQCTEADGTVTCALGTLARGASATVTIVVRPTAAGQLENNAALSADEEDTQQDNNTARATTTVNGAVGPDLIGT